MPLELGPCTHCGKPVLKHLGVVDYGNLYCDKLCRKDDEPRLIKNGAITIPAETKDTAPQIIADDWVKGVWEHITDHPIKIESREHLRAVCEQHNCAPRMFVKPKSQGRGVEINWKR